MLTWRMHSHPCLYTKDPVSTVALRRPSTASLRPCLAQDHEEHTATAPAPWRIRWWARKSWLRPTHPRILPPPSLGWVKTASIRVPLSPFRTLCLSCYPKYGRVKGCLCAVPCLCDSLRRHPHLRLHPKGCFLSLLHGRKLKSTLPVRGVWTQLRLQTATLTCATGWQTTPGQSAEAPLQAQPIPSAQAPRRLSRQPISTTLPTTLASHWLRGICWMLCWKRRNSSELGGKYQLRPAWILVQTGLTGLGMFIFALGEWRYWTSGSCFLPSGPCTQTII